MDRIMIFIDGNNLDNAVKNLYTTIGSPTIPRVELVKLAELITSKLHGKLQRFYYYTGISTFDKEKREATQNFLNVLNNKAPRCIAKAGNLILLGKDSITGKDIITEKGTDVHIAVDMLSLAYHNAYDVAVLVSADTDYIPAINAVRSVGKIVVACVIEHQKAGVIKEKCDQHIILNRADIDSCQR